MSDANAFSEEVLAAAAEVVRTSVKPAGQFSPFTRSGATAKRVAEEMGWWKGGVTRSGRRKAEVSKARAALKVLVARGIIVSGGKERTLSCGSTETEVWLPAGAK